MKILAILVFALILSAPCLAAEDTIGNLQPSSQAPSAPLRPGAWVILPDGRPTLIEEALPNGQLRTDLGVILTPEGVIAEGEGKGEAVALIPDKAKPAVEPSAPEQSAPEAPKAPDIGVMLPGAKAPEPPASDKPEQKKAEAPGQRGQPEPQARPEQAGQPDKQLTLVELLPMTRVPEAKTTAEQAHPEEKAPEAKTPAKEPKKPEQKKPEPKKPEQKKAEAPKKPAQQAKKPAVGEEMRIPQDAAKTGDLAFLEGCWQGTRPEYYSKRTIKECFCFGAGGRSGKRRVIDPIGKRMCIGSTRASLSKDGVLSVSSSGAACNDGERWGQAEMVCKNSGPRTPCSWVFRDAQNGRQSYQIPFVRVESCGR